MFYVIGARNDLRWTCGYRLTSGLYFASADFGSYMCVHLATTSKTSLANNHLFHANVSSSNICNTQLLATKKSNESSRVHILSMAMAPVAKTTTVSGPFLVMVVVERSRGLVWWRRSTLTSLLTRSQPVIMPSCLCRHCCSKSRNRRLARTHLASYRTIKR